MQGECLPTQTTPPACWGCVAELWCFSLLHRSETRQTLCEEHFLICLNQYFIIIINTYDSVLSSNINVLLEFEHEVMTKTWPLPENLPSPQPQDPDGAVVAEAPPTDENPCQVQDELWRVRLGPAGTRDPGATQRDQHLSDHLNGGRSASLQQWPLLTWWVIDCGLINEGRF